VEELKAVAALTVAAQNVTDGIGFGKRLGTMLIVATLRQLPADLCFDGGSTVKQRSTGVVSVDLRASEVIWGISTVWDKKKLFRLEYEETSMGLDEVIMWFDVTPFSPLAMHMKHIAYERLIRFSPFNSS
jgi:hypothetical protein